MGTVSVVTDHIDTFTPAGIRLCSGVELAADIIVTATGLVMKLLGGMQLVVDGRPVDLSQTMSYKGMMFSNIPNLAAAIGYTNASWTLKCELASRYVCRLLKFMDRHGYVQCTPRKKNPAITEEPALSFTSGYVQRALPSLPHQGSQRPWKVYQNYILDMITFRLGKVDDGTASLDFEPEEQKRKTSISTAVGHVEWKKNKINIAIIGLGFGAEFIPIYQRHPNAHLVAICQRNRRKLQRLP